MTEPDFQTTSSAGSRSSETSTLKETTMKKILVSMTALLLSLHAAAAPKSDSADKLGKDIAVFYKNPSAERAAFLMDQLIKADLMRETTLAWGTQALQKYPQGSTIWCDNIRTYQGDALTFAAYTLTLTGTNQAKTCLNSLTLDTELKKNLKKKQKLPSASRTHHFPCITGFSLGNLFCHRQPESSRAYRRLHHQSPNGCRPTPQPCRPHTCLCHLVNPIQYGTRYGD